MLPTDHQSLAAAQHILEAAKQIQIEAMKLAELASGREQTPTESER